MSNDKPLKSAYELAMDRLKAEDRESGVEQAKPLTDEQKASIAELRTQARAKRAEIEILHEKSREAATDAEQLTQLEERFETDCRRVDSSLESAIARIRRGETVEAL